MTKANLVGALIVLLLTVTSFGSLGIISPGFVMPLKRGGPVQQIFIGVSTLLGGVFYPVSVLPDWLEAVSYHIPITYSLEGMRLALLRGYTLWGLMPNLIPLILFSVILLPVWVFIFGYAVKRAKKDGTLTHY